MEEERMEYVREQEMMYGTCCNVIPISTRDFLTIQTNAGGQLMIGYELNADIVDRVYEYYTYNRERNDVTSNFPLYSRIDRKTIITQRDVVQKEYDLVFSEGSGPQQEEMLNFIEYKVNVWEKKLHVMNTLHEDLLQEISSYSFMRIECYDPKNEKLPILNKIYQAFYMIRNDLAELYFNESYLTIFRGFEITNRLEDQKQIGSFTSTISYSCYIKRRM